MAHQQTPIPLDAPDLLACLEDAVKDIARHGATQPLKDMESVDEWREWAERFRRSERNLRVLRASAQLAGVPFDVDFSTRIILGAAQGAATVVESTPANGVREGVDEADAAPGPSANKRKRKNRA